MMSDRLIFQTQGAFGLQVAERGGPAVASLAVKDWESGFLGRRFGLLSLDEAGLSTLPTGEIAGLLDRVVAFADQSDFHIVETIAEIDGVAYFPLLEERGFRLVDTRISFVTWMDRNAIAPCPMETGEIRLATAQDLPGILALTHASFADNPAFFSRFKNRSYYSEIQTRAYFAAWIENHLGVDDVYFCVLEDRGAVVGYFFYKKGGLYRDRPLYKGVLTAVRPDYRGENAQLAMQAFLYRHFPDDEFYLDNTTQLTNAPVIRNHVKSQKRLKQIALIFYRKHP